MRALEWVPRVPGAELAEHVAANCLRRIDEARTYLIDERKLSEAIVERAIRRRAVGFNTWTSDKIPPGEPLHGGPAVAFICRSLNPGRVMAVDTRYLDPELNGGMKTQAIGEKMGTPFFTDRGELERARTVFVLESPINALTAECARIPYSAALATRGTGTVESIDWRFLVGKRVILCMDNDQPNEKGHCPGQKAAWRLHELLTAQNISALLVDQRMWDDHGFNDLNDVIQAEGEAGVKQRLNTLEPWALAGLPGKGDSYRKKRLFLPSHDWAQYWRFRTKEDFTTCVKEVKEDDDGNEKELFQDICGFRVASLSRVTIAGATSVMTGEKDRRHDMALSSSAEYSRTISCTTPINGRSSGRSTLAHNSSA